MCRILSRRAGGYSVNISDVYLSTPTTGEAIYMEKVLKIRDVLQRMNKQDNLYPNYLHPNTGNWGQRKLL